MLRSAPWKAAAAVGLVLFICLQVLPAIVPAMKKEAAALSRGKAEQLALVYAENRWGTAESDLSDVTITQLGDDRMTAYLTKHKLTDEYDKSWDAAYPMDVYAVDLQLSDRSMERILLHIETGEVVGWAYSTGAVRTDEDKAADADAERVTAEAMAWLKQQPDFDAAAWEPLGKVDGNGAAVLQSRKSGLLDAHLQLLVKPDRMMIYRYALPEGFAGEIDRQHKIADKLSMVGFLLPQIVLFVLAVVYAAACRGWSSFKRGLFLSAAFFVMYAGFMFNLRPGLRATSADTLTSFSENGVNALLAVNIVIFFVQALLTYFAAVGGDGLWRSMGYTLWPRWQDADYGSRVVSAMKQGYMLAVILLGAQTVVLTGLTQLLGSYYGSDASQSVYNMYYPWLLPLLAWCAGISEEIQTRFFGIGMVRKWLVALSRAMLGRETGSSGTRALTAIAYVPANLVWAFGHVGYAVYPWHTRLIELMIVGALFAWFMLRFGLMAVIFAHVILDTTLMSLQLLSDGLSSDNLAGFVSLLLPAAIALLIGWLHKRRRGGAFGGSGTADGQRAGV